MEKPTPTIDHEPPSQVTTQALQPQPCGWITKSIWLDMMLVALVVALLQSVFTGTLTAGFPVLQSCQDGIFCLLPLNQLHAAFAL